MRPREIEHKPMPDISKVLTLALDYNHNLATADISTIYMWVNENCLVEDDILPALEAIMKRKKGISTFSYFTRPVREARDRRLMKSEIKRKTETTANDPHWRARNIAWKRDRLNGVALSRQDEDYLREYEQQHGRVII